MSMQYCRECDNMIDLDYDSEHFEGAHEKQMDLGQFSGKEFNRSLAGEKFQWIKKKQSRKSFWRNERRVQTTKHAQLVGMIRNIIQNHVKHGDVIAKSSYLRRHKKPLKMQGVGKSFIHIKESVWFRVEVNVNMIKERNIRFIYVLTGKMQGMLIVRGKMHVQRL